MGKYTQEQINQAKNKNLLEYIQSRGYEIFESAKGEYRLREHDSLVISKNKWNWFSRQEGGNILDFIIKYEGKGFLEAMDILMGNNKMIGRNQAPIEIKKTEVLKGSLELPDKNDNYRRVFAYLSKTRGISAKIIQSMINEGKLYEDKEHHNCVFVGYNGKGEAKYALKVGTSTYKKFKGEVDNSDKSFGLELCSPAESQAVYVYESIIDAMSHADIITMNGKNYALENRISLGGVSDMKLEEFLKNKNIKKIVVCTDNDKAGDKAAKSIYKKYSARGYEVKRILPKNKDFNDDLKTIRKIQDKGVTLDDISLNIELHKSCSNEAKQPAEDKKYEAIR